MPPATASRSFARQNAPLVSRALPRASIIRPYCLPPTQQPAPFPNVANGSLYIHPFDSEKTPCPLLQSILTVKTLFHRPACAQKRFALPAPNSAIKARFHRPDYAIKRPKHLSSASKSLLQSAPCSAHRKKHEKTRPFAPSNRLSLTDTTKEKLVRSPSTSVILDAPFQPVATRQQTVKRKGGSNAPVQIILTAFGDNRKKTKTDTLATTIKKNAPQQVTPPPDNKSRKRRNRTHSAQSRLYLPTSPLPSAPFFLRRPTSNPLHRSQTP